MSDLYLSPIYGQEHFTLEELGHIRMIKNKAHIICYTKNISLNDAIKIVLNKYYTLNPLNTFEYIFINFQKKVEFEYLIDDSNKIILSKSGDLKEAAANLYDAIIEMDKREFTTLFIERLPDFGLGKTMNDRLNRSTLKFRT